MRLFEFTQPILEGGNVFKGDLATQRIRKEDVLKTVTWLERILGISLRNNLLGSTGRKADSGDVDIGLQQDKVNKDDLVSKLKAWASKSKLRPEDYVRKSGNSVHFRAPITGDPSMGHVQVDLMILPDLKLAQFFMQADPNSQFRDSQKHILMASIAKHNGLRWSPTTGLVSRASGKVIASAPEHVAEVLLGPNFGAKDLVSVENILKTLENDPERESKLSDAKDSLGL
jgi:hypothetical protein